MQVTGRKHLTIIQNTLATEQKCAKKFRASDIFILSYLQKIWNNFVFFSIYFSFLIAISGNTASPALKLTVIKKAHGQVIAVRIWHSVRQMQKYHDIICQKRYQAVKNSI